jgi:hypothetical protein
LTAKRNRQKTTPENWYPRAKSGPPYLF